MKKLAKISMALFAAFGLVALLVSPAFASGTEADNWLQVNDPGVNCTYSYASVNSAASVPPGSTATWAQAATVYRVPSPCNFALASAQSLQAGELGVRGQLVCRWTDNAGDLITQTVWDSGVVYNAANTGLVEAHVGSQTNPCNPTDVRAGTLQERTIVDSYVWTGIGYTHYPTETTHWVTR